MIGIVFQCVSSLGRKHFDYLEKRTVTYIRSTMSINSWRINMSLDMRCSSLHMCLLIRHNYNRLSTIFLFSERSNLHFAAYSISVVSPLIISGIRRELSMMKVERNQIEMFSTHTKDIFSRHLRFWTHTCVLYNCIIDFFWCSGLLWVSSYSSVRFTLPWRFLWRRMSFGHERAGEWRARRRQRCALDSSLYTTKKKKKERKLVETTQAEDVGRIFLFRHSFLSFCTPAPCHARTPEKIKGEKRATLVIESIDGIPISYENPWFTSVLCLTWKGLEWNERNGNR